MSSLICHFCGLWTVVRACVCVLHYIITRAKRRNDMGLESTRKLLVLYIKDVTKDEYSLQNEQIM